MSALVSVGLVRTTVKPSPTPAKAEMEWASGLPLGRPVSPENELLPRKNKKRRGRRKKKHSLDRYLRVDGWHSHHFHIKHSSMVVYPLHTRERNLEYNNTKMKQLLSEEKYPCIHTWPISDKILTHEHNFSMCCFYHALLTGRLLDKKK